MSNINTRFPKGHVPWNKGLTKTDSRVKRYGERGSSTKLQLYKEGKIPPPWNKGLTKEQDSRLQDVANALTGLKRRPESIEKSRINAGKRIREQYQNGERKWWGLDPKNKEIWERVKKVFGGKEAQLKAFHANARHKINKVEKYLQTILDTNFPGKWRFVGDGSFRVGRKFPDFIHITDKKVILVNGIFWHIKFKKRENMNRFLIEAVESIIYKEAGYKVLHIWEDELLSRTKGGLPIYDKDLNLILDKIKSFDI